MPPKPDDDAESLDAIMARLNGEAIAGQGRLADLLNKTPALETGLDTSEMRHTRRVLYATLNVEGVGNAARQIDRIPDPGHATSCIMGGNYHGFDIIPAIQRLAGCPVAELLIATLSFSKRNLAHLGIMMDAGDVEAVGLLTSDYFATADPLIYGAAKRELVEKRGQRLAFTRNHAKVICLRMADGRKLTVESSANLRSCINFEQFTLAHDAGHWAWHRDWIEYLLETGGK